MSDLDIKALLRKHFGAQSIGAVIRRSPRIWCTVLDGNKVIVKRHYPSCEQSIKHLSLIYSEAADAGLGAPLLTDTNGDCLVLKDKRAYSVQHQITGNMPQAPHAPLVATALAKLHAILKGLNVPPLTNHFDRAIPDLLQAAKFFGFENLAPVIARCEVAQKAHSHILHGDLHAANIIIAPQKVIFLDFDSAHTGPWESDIAMAAFRLHPDKQSMQDFASVYSTHSDAVIDPQRLTDYAVRHALERLLFILTQHYQGDSRWMKDYPNQARYLLAACQISGLAAPKIPTPKGELS